MSKTPPAAASSRDMTEKRKEKKKQKEKEKDTGSKNRVVGKRPKVASFRAPP